MNAMEQLASSTGGKAYFNTNDLNTAMRLAINDGANDYTLGYSPTEKKMDGSYRQIEVKVANGKYKLAYRHQLGYLTASARPSADGTPHPQQSAQPQDVPGTLPV